MENKFIDLHCHSTLKPFSKSFSRKSTQGINTLDINFKRSIWYKTHIKLFKKVLNALITLTKFTQADFTSAIEGGAKILMVSVDPMERELILSKNKTKQRKTGKFIKNLVQGIGQKRINYLYNLDNYFEDLQKNIHFLKQLENEHKSINGKSSTYKIVDSYEDIDLQTENTIYIVLTIEGGHALRSSLYKGISTIENQAKIFDNISKLKHTGSIPTPFFVSLAHHFPNGLCGHAKSLTGIASLAYNQEENADLGLLPLGRKVIDLLLKNINEKRIYIDLKHMNLKSRKEFYDYLETPRYANEDIPIIVSHGATNYLPWPSQPDNEINFYKEEIVKIAGSGGIFGVQLDARRLRKMKYGSKRRGIRNDVDIKGLYKKAFFVWRQIEVLALLIYKAKNEQMGFERIDPWGFQVVGSDFDGIVDPLDGYWTYSEMPLLQEYLIKQANAFLRTKTAKKLPDYNQLKAISIVNKFLFDNANRFLMKYLTR
ncbi:membrane dipeptidase [Winogradskyella schleiferi]|uniref:membrane dipeptidase n=1 Tax=Winogradskyella schleiferi TaxID=2686078 RepID=UPI0015BDE377|nr:membrane dipeptidase [Winogradskyella schleiferi]